MKPLPRPESVRRTAMAIATLDLILSPEREYRYYSYNSRWTDGEEMASMRDGEGDEWFLLFLDSGWCGLKGLDHESAAAKSNDLPAKVQAALPGELDEFRDEPAFAWEDTSFCYWFDPSHAEWIDAVLMAGFAPDLDTGMPFDDAYQQSLSMYDLGL